ncbi:MAG: ATP-binding cassette domain-containing protein, partial [Planctomycetes bacterium]|nr:ATP-binding cassette domain-containing protein [Planctomycetota bacterium]
GIVGIIGPNGAGKTTLLRLVSGLVWPSDGAVRVLGQQTGVLSGRALHAFRRRVGFLHQQDNLVPQLRVAHNVLMGRLGAWSWWRALSSLLFPRELDRAEAALRRVELGDRLWAMPDELSGGERQRVAIARLLLQEPEVVLADEPVSSLDVRLGREIVARLLELADGDRALICSLHSLALLDAGFDRVVALRGGAVCFDGVPAELDRGRLREIYGAELARVEAAS